MLADGDVRLFWQQFRCGIDGWLVCGIVVSGAWREHHGRHEVREAVGDQSSKLS